MDAQSPIREELMRKALELAARGRGWVEPNPMVGCVIERGGQILGEGWHRRFGGPHAEREAINACTVSPAGATAYVTLEPCCHLEKKTPPCVLVLIEAKLARVVVACADPNPEVAGKGIAQLRAAGIEVHVGMLENAAKQLNAAFFKCMLQQRPYVTLKWAETADGKVAGAGGKRMQISNERSMRAMHELRARCDAIVVGIGTVLSDDPMLTARVDNPPRVPDRVVLDSSLRIPMDSKLVRSAREVPLTVCCYSGNLTADVLKSKQLQDLGVELLDLDPVDLTKHNDDQRMSITELLFHLYNCDMTHVLVEGGPTFARSFLQQNLADRVWVFHSTKRVDAADAPSAPEIDWPISAEVEFDGDRLVERLNPRSPVFYELLPSADFPR